MQEILSDNRLKEMAVIPGTWLCAPDSIQEAFEGNSEELLYISHWDAKIKAAGKNIQILLVYTIKAFL